MGTITLKEIAVYFSHELLFEVESVDGKEILCLTGIYSKDGFDIIQISNTDYYIGEENDFTAKPLLYNLSILTQEIEHNGEKFVPINKIDELAESISYYSLDFYLRSTKSLPIWVIEKLQEWHIDYQDLIGRGLAINKSKT